MSRLSLPFFIFAVAACGDNGANPSPEPHHEPPANRPADGGSEPVGAGFAVVNSDFVSTSISLLDRATGQVSKADCIDSATAPPTSTLALSGDVVLPSQPQPGNPLLAIDRTNSALTWIDPATCTPLRQLDVSTGFFANPHDVVGLSPAKAYVLRYERNGNPTPDPADRDDGDDILIIDPSVPAITGRIPLSSFAVAVPGAAIQARPDRALAIDGKVYVALSNLSEDFTAAGHGRILVVDAATDQVTATIDLPDTKNCSDLSYVAATKTLMIACSGAFSDANQAAGTGIVYIDLGASPATVTRTIPAAAFGGRAISTFSGIARDGALGFAVTFGEFGAAPPDQLWTVDPAAGAATKIVDAGDAFTFGTVLVDRSQSRVYLTDASTATPRVQIYDYDGATPVHEASIVSDPAHGLPPRELAWY